MAEMAGRLYTAEEQAGHRAAWKARLRSGEVKQLRNALRDHDGSAMCWLGVGYDVSGLGEWWQDKDERWHYGIYPEDLDDDVLASYYGYDFSILDPYELYWTYLDEGSARYDLRGDDFDAMANWMDWIEDGHLVCGAI